MREGLFLFLFHKNGWLFRKQNKLQDELKYRLDGFCAYWERYTLPSGDYRRPQPQKNCFLRDLTANREKFHGAALLLQLALNLGDELFSPAINVILSIKEGATLGIALSFQSFDLLLAGQLFLQG